jgi:alkanesulfonate monooxygenase SsuD/methylene tetrahydromethanopterin reductase-like flavin-dependent oxidoreductase (luciferase family)
VAERSRAPLRLGLALSGPTDADAWRKTIALAEWADRHGFDSVWLPEGHLRPGATSAPLVALAAIAARTERVRLGTTSLLLSIHDPARVALEVAALDQLSNGRVILGVGRGFDPAMFRAFGVDPREKRDRFDEALDAILAAWRAAKGVAATAAAGPECPAQDPHPPIWVAAFGPKGLAQAARRGLPYLASPIESFGTLVENYARHAAQLPPGVDPAALPVPVMRTVHVAESDAEARRVSDASEAEFAAIASRARGAIAARAVGAAADRVIIGTASAVADRIAAYREQVVIDHLIVRPPSRIGDDSRLRSLEALTQLVAG